MPLAKEPGAVPPSYFFNGAAAAGLGATVLVWLLGRIPLTRDVALIALVLALLGGAVLALAYRKLPPPHRPVVLVLNLAVMALPAAALGWFFGPNSAYQALVATVLVMLGALAGSSPRLLARAGVWLVYLAVAGAQLVVLLLIINGVLADVSLTRVIIPGHPMGHHLAAHLSLQGIFFAAFLVGRGFQRRYARLAARVEEIVRTTSRREILLQEARAEYQRTLELGRTGALSGKTVGDYRLGMVVAHEEGTDIYEAIDGGGRSTQVHVEEGVDPPHVRDVNAQFPTEDERSDRGDEAGAAEHAEGPETEEALAVRLATGPLSEAELEALVEDLVRVLSELHRRGLVHATVTPETVVRTRAGWTLAKTARRSPSSPEVLAYLAPERVRGGQAGPRSDLYSCAAVVYHAATGRAPYAHVADENLAKAVLEGLPQRPNSIATIHPSLQEALRIGLARTADERFPSASALGLAFRNAFREDSDRSLRSRCLALSHDWEDAAETEPSSHAVDTVDEKPRSRAREQSSHPRMAVGASPSHAPADAFREAFRTKMRDQRLLVTLLCGGGAAILWSIARETLPFYVASACIAGILLLVWISTSLVRKGGEAPYWPWVIIAALSVGPAYCLGLHSAVTAVVAVLVVSGGVFASGSERGAGRRRVVLLSLLATYTGFFLLMAADTIPDQGNVPVFDSVAPRWEAAAIHALLMATFGAAYLAGQLIERRYEALTARAESAGREAAEQELLLAEAREELETLAQVGGIFTGLRVGRFDVGALLGRGGMGEVYEARTESERVALKVVRGDRVAEPRALRMLIEEAEALRRVESPFVARIVEVADLEADLPFIAMEFIEGDSLEAMLRNQERLDMNAARHLIRDIAKGLADVHAANVLHCDIKPYNVVHTGEQWKLVDFGVARRPDGTVLDRSSRAGTPGYMAPEHGLGEGVDERSDLYSLSVVAYRALTGRPPYAGTDPATVARKALEEGPPDPRQWMRLHEDVLLALRLGMAGNPDERYQTADALAAAFEQAFEGRLSNDLRDQGRRLPWS
ncbi:MAG: serine/threonine-protein kinase [Myxococcota bacterium]